VLHLSNIFCKILTEDGSFNNLTHDCKKVFMLLTFSKGYASLVWSIKDGIPYIGEFIFFYTTYVNMTFFLRNSFLASLNVSFSFLASNCLCGSIFFLTHWCCAGSCFIASDPILAPLRVTILMFLPSSFTSAEIHWTFWLFWFLFSWIFPKSVGQSYVSWSIARQYIHVTGGSGHSLA